jgi:hypothetical protein
VPRAHDSCIYILVLSNSGRETCAGRACLQRAARSLDVEVLPAECLGCVCSAALAI